MKDCSSLRVVLMGVAPAREECTWWAPHMHALAAKSSHRRESLYVGIVFFWYCVFYTLVLLIQSESYTSYGITSTIQQAFAPQVRIASQP